MPEKRGLPVSSAGSVAHVPDNGGSQPWEPPGWCTTPSPESARLALVLRTQLSSDSATTRIEELCKRDRYMLGREGLVQIRLEARMASRTHACLFHDKDGGTYICDLGSSHGTYLGSKRLTKYQAAEVAVGDIVGIGACPGSQKRDREEATLVVRDPQTGEWSSEPLVAAAKVTQRRSSASSGKSKKKRPSDEQKANQIAAAVAAAASAAALSAASSSSRAVPSSRSKKSAGPTPKPVSPTQAPIAASFAEPTAMSPTDLPSPGGAGGKRKLGADGQAARTKAEKTRRKSREFAAEGSFFEGVFREVEPNTAALVMRDDQNGALTSHAEAVAAKLLKKLPEKLKLQRLNGKKPAKHLSKRKDVEITVVRVRLKNKSPKAEGLRWKVQEIVPVSSSAPWLGDGHYQALQVPRDASRSDIRAAYKRRVLETHPDKGGQASEFHSVSMAFEVLGHPERRADYDRELARTGSNDGLDTAGATQVGRRKSRSTGNKDNLKGAARVLQMELLENGKGPDWKKDLQALDFDMLHALQAELSRRRKKALDKKADEDAPEATDVPESSAASSTKSGVKGLYKHHKSGFYVQVNWSNFTVCSGYTQSLAQAVDWQIALYGLRDTAQARLQQGGFGHPVLEKELRESARQEPTLHMSFSSYLKMRDGRVAATPICQDLEESMKFRSRLATAVQQANSMSKADADEFLKKQKKEAAKEALAAKQRRRALEKQLTAQATAVLGKRRMTESLSSGANKSGRLPAPAKSLALTD